MWKPSSVPNQNVEDEDWQYCCPDIPQQAMPSFTSTLHNKLAAFAEIEEVLSKHGITNDVDFLTVMGAVFAIRGMQLRSD